MAAQQGDLDGLCGLYAVTNALTLLYPEHMKLGAQRGVLRACATALHRWPEILWYGTTAREMSDMLHSASGYCKREFNEIPRWQRLYTKRKPPTIDDYLATLRSLITGTNAVAIVGVEHPWSHWIVISSMGKTTVKCADSQNRKGLTFKLDEAHLGAPKKPDATGVWLDHFSTFVISRDVKDDQ